MSKGKKVTVGIVSWLVLLLVAGAVWYLNYFIECEEISVLNLFTLDRLPVSVANAVLFVLAAVLVETISDTVTGLKECFSEKMLCVAMSLLLMVGFLGYPVKGVLTLSAIKVLFPLVTSLLMVATYMREIPYDCFGSKEPLFAVGLWIVVLGILTGFFSAGLGIAIFVFSILTAVYAKKVGHVVQPWMIAGIVASFIGVVLSVLWPVFETKSFDVVLDTYTDLGMYSEYGLFVLNTVMKDLVCPIVVIVIISIVVKGIYGSFAGREVTYILIMAAVSLAASVFEAEFGGEKTLGCVVLLILVILVLSKRLLEKKESLKKGMIPLTVFIGLVGIYRIVSLIWL